MKFLVDAQLPRRLARWLRGHGFDTIHTRDLPLANRTPDHVITEMSMREQRVVITKDADFVTALTILGKPYKLLLVSTGNIKNPELESLFKGNIEQMVEALSDCDFIELDRTSVIVHH